MAKQIRLRADEEPEDMRDQASANLAAGQQQVAAQAQDDDPAMPSSMVKAQWNLNEAKRAQYESQVQEAKARRASQPSAKAWSYVKGDIARQQQRIAEQDAQAIAEAPLRQDQAELNAAKDQLRLESAVQAEQARAHRAQGGETETDPVTGRTTVARHPDGAAKFKAGPIEGEKPYLHPTIQSSAGTAPGLGEATTLLYGEHTGQSDHLLQPTMDDRGRIADIPLETKTDPATGQIYSETKDQFGQTQRIDLGQDEKIPRLNRIQQELDTSAMELQALDVQRMQIEPRYKPIEDTYRNAKAEIDKPLKFIQEGGQWVENTPEKFRADPVKLQQWQQERGAALNSYKAAAKQYGEIQPVWDGLQQRQQETKLRHEQGILRKKRIELNLPEEDGGIAETVAAAEAGTIPEDQAAVAEHLRSLATVTPGMGDMLLTASGQSEVEMIPEAQREFHTPAEHPLVPQDNPAAVALFTSALRGLNNPGEFTVGGSGKTFREIKRNGSTVATIYQDQENPELPFIAISANDQSAADLRTLVNTEADGGLRVYLKDNILNPPSPTKENAWAIGVYNAVSDPALKADEKALGQYLESNQASPGTLIKRVKAGELSIQVGGKMLKDLYGIQLQTGDYDDPAAFQKWIEETSKRELAEGALPQNTTAAKFAKASKDRLSLSQQENIRNDYAADFIPSNPLLTRAQQKALYAQNARHEVGTIDRLRSMGNAAIDLGKDVAGSSVGMPLGIAEDALYGVAAIGSENARQQIAAKMKLRNMSTEAWRQGVVRFTKALATEGGRAISSERDLAMREWQAVVDRNADAATPDQSAEDAAAQKAIDATLRLHGLAANPDNPIEARHLDPAQDKALRMAMMRYKATADPRAWALLDERMLMSNDRRWVSAEMEELTGPKGGFWGAVNRGMSAGWEEIGSEAISWLTVGTFGAATKGARVLNAAAKGNKAYQATRVGKIGGTIYHGIQKAAQEFDDLGKVAGTLQNPLTTGQRAGNAMLRGSKIAVIGGASEGVEELIPEVGSDKPDFAGAFGAGFLGGVMLLPVGAAQSGIGGTIATHQQQAKLQDSYHRYAREYNRVNSDLAGFQPIDAKTAEFASLFINPQAREQEMQALGAEIEGLRAAVAQEDAALATGQMPSDQYIPMQDRLQRLDAVSTMLAEMDVAAVDAVEGFKNLKPEEKTNLVAYAKAAAGRADLLTPQERRAIQGANAQFKTNIFQGDTVTPEGMAMLVEQYPVLGKLPQFQEAAAPAMDAVPADNVAGTANIERLPGTPEQQQAAGVIAQQVMAEIAAEMPAIAQRVGIGTPTMRVSGGVTASIDAAGQSRIQIIPEDIAHAIASGMTPEQAKARVKDNIVLHETIHALQFQVVAQQAAAAGDASTPDVAAQNFYGGMHAQMAAEAPQMLENGRTLYGEMDDGTAPAWDTLPEWAKAAEVVRMLTEAKLEGRITDVSRLLDGASPGLLQKLAQIVKDMIAAITTGQMPESVKQHVDTLTELYTELLNVTPNPSTANPADSSSQPAPSQPGPGTGPAPQSNSNSQPTGDGASQPAPSDDAGAPPQSAEQATEAIVADEYNKTLKTRPALNDKRVADIKGLLRSLSFDTYAAAAADPPNARRIAQDAFGAFLQNPEVRAALGEIELENRAKAKEHRQSAQRRVDAVAAQVIDGIPLLKAMDAHGLRFKAPPRGFDLLRARVKAAKDNLHIRISQKNRAIYDEFTAAGYEGMPLIGDYPGGGKNAVIASIIRRFFSENATKSPDQIQDTRIDDVPVLEPHLKGQSIMGAFAKAINDYAWDRTTIDSLDDPDADVSGKSDAEIAELEAKAERDAFTDAWRMRTGNQNLTHARAKAIAEEYDRIVAEQGEPDSQEADDAYAAQALAAADQRGKPAPKAETREALDKVETEGSAALLNPRVEGLEGQSAPRGDLSGKTQPLSTADLQAIQRNGAGITAPPTDGPLKQAVDAFVVKAQAMMPMFQGNKVQMAKYVASAILRYWSKAQRDAVTTFYDLFAGGGAWGLVLADTFFPNVKKFVINEFDTPRSIKVREQMVNGHRFAEVIQKDDTQKIIKGILQDYYARSKGVTWGGIYAQFEKWSEQNAGKFDDTTIAIIKMLADDSTLGAPAAWGNLQEEIGKELDGRPVMQRRGPNADEVTKWFLGRHAKWAETIHQTYQRMVDRGVDFTFRNGDAYTMDVESGKHVFVTADPPYFATTGYDDSIVGPGMYAATRNLMRRLTGQDNNVAYTDEAWWVKDSINDKITDADLVEGAEIATQIAKTLDFMVVAGKIESRYETLGLHNPAGSPVAPGRTANPDGNESRPDGGNLQQEGRGPDGRGTAGDVAPGPVGEAGLQSPGDEASLGSAPVQSRSTAALRDLIAYNPGGRFGDGSPAAAEKAIVDLVAQGRNVPSNPYVLRVVPVSDLTPTQTGEDYLNDSSRETARRIASGEVIEARWQDALPIFANKDGTINDGHHRHAAATLNGDQTIPAVVPADSHLAQNPSLFSAPAQPLDRKNPFGEWGASLKENDILIGYRGEKGNGQADNNFGSSEGIGLYVAKTRQDTEFFGKARQVNFPQPKRPLIVDEDGGLDIIPLLNDDNDVIWNRIFSHKTRENDSDWMKAHILAAKQIGLTEDTWLERIDAYPRALTDKLLAMGYDAVYVRSGGMEWVNLLAKPGQRFNRGTRTERGTALYSPAANPGFYSKLERELESKLPDNAPIDQVIGIARNNARPEEIKWTGIIPKAQELAAANKGRVPKQAILDYLRGEGAVRFEEVVIQDNRGEGFTVEESEGVWVVKNREGQAVNFGKTREEAEQWRTQYEGSGIGSSTKWASYTLPGGENYREVVLAIPADFSATQKKLDELNNRAAELLSNAMELYSNKDRSPEDARIYAERSAEYERVNKEREQLASAARSGDTGEVYKSGHFPNIPNYVAHYRAADHTAPDGKRGTLLETLQSDRHQAGKDAGYHFNTKRWLEITRKYFGDDMSLPVSTSALRTIGATQEEIAEIEPLEKEARAATSARVADAPYRKDWHVQLFKRALRDAVERGQDWIGWTDGATQAKRWRGNDPVAMETFYDKVVPQDINRYVKQWDAKASLSGIVANPPSWAVVNKETGAKMMGAVWGTRAEAENLLNSQINRAQQSAFEVRLIENDTQTPIWRVDITPEMRKGVQQGQALFSPAASNPAANSDADPSPESVAQAAKEFRRAAASIRPDVKVVESSDHYQQGAGWFDPDIPDTVFFNPKTIAWGLMKRPDLLKKGAFVIAQEEIIHLESVEALGYDGVANVARALNQEDRLLLAREYAGVEGDAPTENQQELIDSLLNDEAWLGAEALRMIKQMLDQGYTSETITNLADKPPSFVESVLRYLKNIIRRISANRSIKEAPESVRRAVVELEKMRNKKTTNQKRQSGSIFKSAARRPSNPSAQYRYLKAKEEKTGLTPAEQQALLRAEQAMGQSFAIDMDDPALKARKGSVSPAFQPTLNLERTHPITGQQLALFSAPAQPITREQYTRHATLESKHNSGTITDAETSEASALVKSAAASKGYTQKVFHGTVKKKPRILQPSFEAGEGIFTTDNPDVAHIFRYEREYGEVITEIYDEATEEYEEVEPGALLELYINPGRQLDLSETDVDPQAFVLDTGLQSRVLKKAIADGYDSVLVPDVEEGVGDWMEEGSTTILFRPEQLKSAEPFTGISLSQRFNPESDSILHSAPAQPDFQAITEAALRGLDPIYGDVLKASMESPTPTPEAIAERFNIPLRAVHNIIGTVRARIQAQGRAARPGGLQPARTADGTIKDGMPKRAGSTIPPLAAVDQIQKQEGHPLGQSDADINAAGQAIAERPDALDFLLSTFRGGNRTPMVVNATLRYLNDASIRGDQSPKLTELAILYREEGSDWSNKGRARKDPYLTPSERNALIFQELFTAPNKQVRNAYEEAKTPEAKFAILEAWNAKVKGIKETMKNRGVDIDAALARLAEQRANVHAGENHASSIHQKLVDGLNAEVAQLRQQLAAAQGEAAQAAARAKLEAAEENAAKAVELDPRNTIRLELEKLKKEERMIIDRLRETQDLEDTARWGLMKVPDLVRLVERFQDAVAYAADQAMELAQNILLDRQATLQSPAANVPNQENRKRPSALGLAMAKISTGIDLSTLQRKRKGLPPKGTRKSKATATPEEGPPMMSDAEFAARQSNPQTWRPLWQAEAALSGQRITFEQWQAKPETQALKQRQERMFKEPVNETKGDLDLNDPISVKRAYDAFNIHNASLFDKAAEIWRMGILTGPQTAIVNFGGNIAHSLYQLGPRRLLEAGVNDVLGIIGMGSKDAATLGELRVMSKQIHKALGKAGSDMIRSWNGDTRVVESEVLALAQQLDLAGGVAADHSPRAAGGWYTDALHGASFRHMTAADEFLKSFHGHVEVAAIAYRMARKEGLKGDAMESRIAELMEYGSPAWVQAYQSAEWVTFQTRPDKDDKRSLAFLDRAAKAIRRYTMSDTGRTIEVSYVTKDGKLGKRTAPVLKPNAFVFFFPFINTPLNIFKIGIEMSPVGAFFSLVDATRALHARVGKGHLTPELAKAEAAELYNKRRLVNDLTNQIIGAGLFWALGTLVKPDDDDELPFITGSVDWKRTSRGDRDLRARVMPAYSIRIGGKIFSYQRVEPFGTALGFLVDARLAVEKHGGLNDAALGEFMTTAINQLDNKTYLQGVSDLFNLWHDPSRFASKTAGNLVTGFVPNLIRQPIREADPLIRDTSPASEDGFMQAIGKRLGYSLAPGYAPPMLDVWGNPLQRNPGQQLLGNPITDVIWRVFDPTHLSIGKEIDPIDRYLFNWNNSQAEPKDRFNIEPIRDVLDIRGVKVAISQEDHLAANRRAGQAAREVLGDDWNPTQPTEQGVERIKEVVRTFQKRERDALRAKYAATLPERGL